MLNVCAFVGRLVAEPEVRQMQNGEVLCRFRIAVDRDFVRQGEQRQADFFSCVAFRRTGEFVSKYFHKGSWIAVNGRMRQDSYTDKTGAQRTSYELNCDNVSFVGNKSDNQSAGGYAPAPQLLPTWAASARSLTRCPVIPPAATTILLSSTTTRICPSNRI